MWKPRLAMSPFLSSLPQCSPTAPTLRVLPFSAPTLLSQCGVIISWAQLAQASSLIPNQSQTQHAISVLFGTSALPHQGPGTAFIDGDGSSYVGLPSPGNHSPVLAYWRRISSWQGNTLLLLLLLLSPCEAMGKV